jgi:hypothetical protein
MRMRQRELRFRQRLPMTQPDLACSPHRGSAQQVFDRAPDEVRYQEDSSAPSGDPAKIPENSAVASELANPLLLSASAEVFNSPGALTELADAKSTAPNESAVVIKGSAEGGL